MLIVPAGAPPVVAEVSGAIAGSPRGAAATLATGDDHTCVIDATGHVRCWGTLASVDLGEGRTAVDVGAGAAFSCALLDDATVTCWGANTSGQLGQGIALAGDRSSVDLGSGRTARSITVGGEHACALLDTDDVVCWGSGSDGQLGSGSSDAVGDADGELGDDLVPVDLGTGRTATAVSAGAAHTCAVLDDGDVKCWGSGADGRLGSGGIANIGDGPSQMGDALMPVELGVGRAASSVSAGLDHTCAVLDNGDVKCWGAGSAGKTGHGDTESIGDQAGEMAALDALALGGTAVAVAAGADHSCVLFDDDTVKCFGAATFGALGVAVTDPIGDAPGEIAGLAAVDVGARRVLAIAAGGAHTCVTFADESVACWGRNDVGQLGNGTLDDIGDDAGEMGINLARVDLGQQQLPQPAVIRATQVASGAVHACAVLETGSVKCWGAIGSGMSVGDGVGPSVAAADIVDLGTGRTADAIAIKTNTCVLLDGGDVKCWGRGAEGQLGQGSPDSIGIDEVGDGLAPIDLGTGRTAQAVTVGSLHACALLDDASIKCWGWGFFGQLGSGNPDSIGDGAGEMGDDLDPVDLGTGRTAKAVSAGSQHTCALLDNDTVKCWGRNSDGQLGYGNFDTIGDEGGEMGDDLDPVDLGLGRTATSVVAGSDHNCAILDDSTLKCWGAGDVGQLGSGSTSDIGSNPNQMGDDLDPVELGAGRTPQLVTADYRHTCALLDDDTIKCWGFGDLGRLGYGNTDGIGDGPDGMGGSEMGDNLDPVDLGAGRTAQAVDAGDRITCALLDDHTVKCWGRGQNGQLGLGNTLDVGDGVGPSVADAGVVAVARPEASRSIVTGDAHTCALFDDGAVACWGDGGFGRLGNESTDTIGNSGGEMGADLATVDLGSERTATALAAGERHTCALLDDASVKCWGSGADGRLGSGSTDDVGDGLGEMGDALQPVDFGLGRGAVAIAAGDAHTCALLDDASVKCWGSGADGRLGSGSTDDVGDGAGTSVASAGEVDLGFGYTAVAVVAGDRHTCALLVDASVTCWGSGADGRLGFESTDNVGDGVGTSVANAGQVDLGTGRSALTLVAGGEHTCALLDDVTVKCWGSGFEGQLGYDDTANVGDGVGVSVASVGAVDFGAGRNAVALTAGQAHTCALLDDVTVTCWGDGDFGRLGYGNTARVGNGVGPSVATAGAVELVAGRTAQAVAAGGAHTCVLLDDESIQCWGRGSSGRLGYGNTDNVGDGSGPGTALAGVVELSGPMPVVPSMAATGAPVSTSVASGAASGSAVVTWTAPADDAGTTILGYRIEQSVDGVSWSDAVADTGTTATSAALSGLAVGVDHRFRVSAINQVGRSPQSLASAVFTPTAQPTATLAVAAGQSHPAASGAIRFAVTFDQPVTGLAAGDLTVGGTAGVAAATVSGSGNTYIATVAEPSVAGTVSVSVGANVVTNANGQSNTASNTATVTFAPVIPEPDAFVSLAPERFVDTRSNGETLDAQFEKTGKREAASEYRIRLAGRGDVPEGAVAVVANVTAVGAEGPGFVTAHPCVTPRPNASSLNYTQGVNLGNEIIAPLTASGDLCLFTAQAVHFTVDVSGYVAADAPTVALTPARFLDTRANGATFDGESQRTGLPGAGGSTTLQIAGRNGIPADAAAVIVNVTAIRATSAGFVTVHPCLATPPLASSLNHVDGVNRANEIIATLDAQGRICLFTSAAIHLAADVVGYLPASSNLSAVGPSRLLDTRANAMTVDGFNQGEGVRPGGTEYELQVAGRPGVPADATTAVVNVTAVRATGRGFITIHPCLDTRPLASSLNYVEGVNGGNEVITQLDTNGRICIYSHTTAHVTIDIVAAS